MVLVASGSAPAPKLDHTLLLPLHSFQTNAADFTFRPSDKDAAQAEGA